MELTKGRKVHQWSHQADFLLSCIGYAVGLGNIWRFPYLTMKNGGGAFLIPYLFFMLTAGIPLFFLELSLGQFTSLSPIRVWDIAPLFKGLGFAMCLLSGIVTIYLNTVLTWALYYLYHSFTTGSLPWTTCSNAWNTVNCELRGNASARIAAMTSYAANATSEATEAVVTSVGELVNGTVVANGENRTMTPAEEFWKYNTLQMTSGITELGSLRWELVLCHVIGWSVITLCLIKGIKSSGKVVYVTATMPYIFLTVLLVRGATMPGALDGVLFYIKPDFSKLSDFNIWAEACIQIFFSLGPAWGALITMASFNKFDNNCLRDACVIPLVNCGTSIFGGFVIFSIIGGMAHRAGLPVQDVITSGVGLAFIAYPEALSHLSWAPLWSVCFFLMLFTIGLDTQFALFETLVAGVCEQFDIKKRRFLVTIGLAAAGCVCGFIFCTEGGVYVFQIVDWYSSALGTLTIGFLEAMCISWFYGIGRFSLDIKMMLGRRPPQIFKLFLPFFVPIVLATALIYSLVMFSSPTMGDYSYPAWSRALGWAISAVPIIPIVFVFIKSIVLSAGTVKERWAYLTTPTERWGPASLENRIMYQSRLTDGSKSDSETSNESYKLKEDLEEGLEKVDIDIA